jgi:membrane-bound lytic murein transglycosylase D
LGLFYFFHMKIQFQGFSVLLISVFVLVFSTCGMKTREKDAKDSVTVKGGPYKAPPIPDSVYFMEEKVPLDRFDVYECLEREMLVNTYFHSQTIRFIKLAPRYFSLVDPILKSEGLPADFRYLMVAESNLSPKAFSPAGAAGLWQFMKTTATEYGLEVNNEVDERYHIEKSTLAACRYIKNAWNKYRNWGLVAAGYNAGFAAVDKQIGRQKAGNYFDLLMTEETERYVYRIISLKLILENPGKYGFDVGEEEKYPLFKTHKVEIKGPVPDFADYAASYGITYKTLKYYNPWLRETFLTNKTGKTYFIDIPDAKQ